MPEQNPSMSDFARNPLIYKLVNITPVDWMLEKDFDAMKLQQCAMEKVEGVVAGSTDRAGQHDLPLLTATSSATGALIPERRTFSFDDGSTMTLVYAPGIKQSSGNRWNPQPRNPYYVDRREYGWQYGPVFNPHEYDDLPLHRAGRVRNDSVHGASAVVNHARPITKFDERDDTPAQSGESAVKTAPPTMKRDGQPLLTGSEASKQAREAVRKNPKRMATVAWWRCASLQLANKGNDEDVPALMI